MEQGRRKMRKSGTVKEKNEENLKMKKERRGKEEKIRKLFLLRHCSTCRMK